MLFLVHHSQAVDALIEPQRPLTEGGRAHAEDLAGRAQARGITPEVIWHSGKLRARQTAEPFWRRCNPLAEFSAVRGLQPDDPPAWIADLVRGDPRQIMLVGHMPHIARLHQLLVSPSDRPAEFPQHGMVALEQRGEVWMEIWREA